ncbi:TPA: hypothetical protein NBQ47_004299 [Enterobacter hormaechei]|nr:hypothetical protein [Enterobacter hormaechei]ELW9490456.1 hypothetical protein [Enterobacter hormaechei]HCD4391601.1 hypothetical protein [Enterobacter hormaechei]
MAVPKLKINLLRQGEAAFCRCVGVVLYGEHLVERRLMLQWWADYLDANREKGVSPFEYAQSKLPEAIKIII